MTMNDTNVVIQPKMRVKRHEIMSSHLTARGLLATDVGFWRDFSFLSKPC